MDYVKKIVDEMYSDAERITLVCDQLNTHTIASLYEAFEPQEAHRLARKLQIIHTPKHGSWLNTVRAARAGGTPARDGMAEIEFSALARQCLDQRIPDKDALIQLTTAWMCKRNQAGTSVKWRFTTPDARTKLASLYPKSLL